MNFIKQASWGGRFKEPPAKKMQRFSESISFDHRLAPYDILCSKAHSTMLAKVGLISEAEKNEIHVGLDQIAEEIKDGVFHWDIALEDVHMNIEQRLTERVPAAEKLHTARSRNDQVATDMRLFFKDAADVLTLKINRVIDSLLTLAETYQDTYLPGYTHLQRAQPVSWAHYLLAYVESFDRDRQRLVSFWESANICPLGSGAIAGSTLPIDRNETARILNFVDQEGNPRVTTNSMDAVADRDLFCEFLHLSALCSNHFSRLSEDFILWSTVEFGFIQLPDAFTTGSSLMPQKKNPDAFELLRGKSSRISGHLMTLLQLTKGLPLTYNRDLQDDKPPVFDAYDQMRNGLSILADLLLGCKPVKEKCHNAVSDPLLLATDLADYFVSIGIPFRKAHHLVGDLVALSEKEQVPLDKLKDEAIFKVAPEATEEWRSIFDLERAMKKRENIGMPGPNTVKKQIKRWRSSLPSKITKNEPI